MDVRIPLWVLQSGTPPSNGTETNVTDVLSNPDIGPVGEFLREFGIPFARPLGGVLTFFITLVVLYAFGQASLIPLVNRMLNRRGLTEHTKAPLLRLTKVFVIVVGLFIAFRMAGYGRLLTSLAAIAAAATLAIGFALQDTLANFAAGVFIYIDRPFRIGDWIEWDTYSGTVEDITFRVTRVRTFDNELLTVPNSVLTGGVIKNPVAKDELRISYTFGIGYNDNIEEATEIIREEAENHPDILDDPAPSVRMSTDGALADSSVGLTARVWIKDPNRADFLKVRSEYITAVKTRFDEVGIEIPYPQVNLSGYVGVENPSEAIE